MLRNPPLKVQNRIKAINTTETNKEHQQSCATAGQTGRDVNTENSKTRKRNKAKPIRMLLKKEKLMRIMGRNT